VGDKLEARLVLLDRRFRRHVDRLLQPSSVAR
jgi:hypothetical protein